MVRIYTKTSGKSAVESANVGSFVGNISKN